MDAAGADIEAVHQPGQVGNHQQVALDGGRTERAVHGLFEIGRQRTGGAGVPAAVDRRFVTRRGRAGRETRRDAQGLVATDPGLALPEHALFRTRMILRYGKALDLGDVG